MKSVNCSVCGNAKQLSIWTHTKDRFLMRQNRPDPVHTVICTRCGLAYANPRLDEEEIAALYTTSYRDTDGIPEEHFREKEAQSRERINWLLSHYPIDHSSVLEIGCSEGVLLRQLRDELKWSVTGVEPFEPYARHGIDHWGLNIDTFFFQGERFSNPFDLVMFIHVIEHLPDPLDFLKDVSKVLKPNAHIFFETPNLWTPRIGRISEALFASPHLAIFSPRSIMLVLEKAGFELIELEAKENMRVLAKWNCSSLTSAKQIEGSGLFHAMRMAAQYRTYRLQENSLFTRWAIEAFLVDMGKRFLSPKAYQQIRKLYRST